MAKLSRSRRLKNRNKNQKIQDSKIKPTFYRNSLPSKLYVYRDESKRTRESSDKQKKYIDELVIKYKKLLGLDPVVLCDYSLLSKDAASKTISSYIKKIEEIRVNQ